MQDPKDDKTPDGSKNHFRHTDDRQRTMSTTLRSFPENTPKSTGLAVDRDIRSRQIGLIEPAKPENDVGAQLDAERRWQQRGE